MNKYDELMKLFSELSKMEERLKRLEQIAENNSAVRLICSNREVLKARTGICLRAMKLSETLRKRVYKIETRINELDPPEEVPESEELIWALFG